MRWKALIVYKKGKFEPLHVYFDNFSEFDDMLNAGPAWEDIKEIKIWYKGKPLTLNTKPKSWAEA